MKKTLKIISLMLVLCIALCACGSNNETNTKFSHSKPYDENGYWNGIKASDYVQLPDIEKISIDKSQIDEQIAMFLAYYPNTKDIYDRAKAGKSKQYGQPDPYTKKKTFKKGEEKA